MTSTTPNRDLTASARAALSGHWTTAVLAFLLYTVVIVIAQIIPFAGIVIGFLVTGPLIVGISGLFLSLFRREEERLSPVRIFDGFNNYLNTFLLYLLYLVFVILWSILLIIPGIVAAFSYAMCYFIMADDPTISPLEAIRQSKAMMRGNRWKLFCLYLRFIGWALLCVVTLGIGYLWLWPYMLTSLAAFYEDLKASSAVEATPAPSV